MCCQKFVSACARCWPELSDTTAVIDALIDGSSGTLDRHQLGRQGGEALYARHCLIPGERDIEDWQGTTRSTAI
jgi:hypothetical protein